MYIKKTDFGTMNPQENSMLSELKDKLDSLDKRLEKIELALIGDPALGNEGLTKRLRKVEEDQLTIKEKVEKVYIIAGAVGGVIAVLVQLVGIYFK